MGGVCRFVTHLLSAGLRCNFLPSFHDVNSHVFWRCLNKWLTLASPRG